jgi:hypothetical protein
MGKNIVTKIGLFEMNASLGDVESDHRGGTDYYFLRQTSDPQKDLDRGFSCQAGCWVDSYEDAVKWQEVNGSLIKPQQDPITKGWCYDPELGLSSYGFNNKDTFDRAIYNISEYVHGSSVNGGYGVYVFKSKNFNLNAGLDGEDVFRDGELVCQLPYVIGDDVIEPGMSFDDITKH